PTTPKGGQQNPQNIVGMPKILKTAPRIPRVKTISPRWAGSDRLTAGSYSSWATAPVVKTCLQPGHRTFFPTADLGTLSFRPHDGHSRSRDMKHLVFSV